MSNAQTQVQKMKEDLESILSNIQKHKIFLDKIAHEVHGLLANRSYRKRFEQHYQKFLKKWVVWREVVRQRDEKIAEYRSEAIKNERLCDKQAGSPRDGYTWYDYSPLNMGDPRYGFWGPLCEKRPPNPCLTLHPITANGIPPTNHEEELKKYYVLLAAIHDWMLPSRPLIYDGTCPELLNLLASVIELNLADEGQGIFETALEYVKADLYGREEAEGESRQDKIGFLQELTPEEPSES